MHRTFRTFLLLLFFVLALTLPAAAQSDSVVYVVLFYSPTCPHCHEVIQNHLPVISGNYNTEISWTTSPLEEGQEPPLIGMHGDKLTIIFINTSTEIGSQLYLNAIERFEISDDRLGVPVLYIDDMQLLGSFEIPSELPSLIDSALDEGGNGWPDIPGLEDEIFKLVPVPTEEPTPESETPTAVEPSQIPPENDTLVETPALVLDQSNASITDNVLRDPIGNTASIVVLIGILLSVVGVVFYVSSVPNGETNNDLSWIIPVLVIIGISVAGYLSFVESTGSDAVCGPVGDCNTVQQSSYARLFGLIPVGFLGLLGYAIIFVAWLISRVGSSKTADLTTVFLFITAFAGTLFSIYLTFLEPFIIGATCAWCLSSAILMTLIMWLSAKPATLTMRRLRV